LLFQKENKDRREMAHRYATEAEAKQTAKRLKSNQLRLKALATRVELVDETEEASKVDAATCSSKLVVPGESASMGVDSETVAQRKSLLWRKLSLQERRKSAAVSSVTRGVDQELIAQNPSVPSASKNAGFFTWYKRKHPNGSLMYPTYSK
jgi:hypothetical protein